MVYIVPNSNNMTDYTQNGRIKLISTAEPFMRPTYEQWIKEFNINETAYAIDPSGREHAENIMSNVGIQFDCRTWWEKITGTEVSESVNYRKK